MSGRTARSLGSGALAACALALAPAPATAGPVRPGPDFAGATAPAERGAPEAARRALSRSQLRSEIARAMRNAGGASGAWVADADANSDRVLFADDAGNRRVPASNQKLFTTAAFVDEFGARGNLETRAFARGKLRGRRDRVLKGDLVLVGDGDPAFGTPRFARRHNQPLTSVNSLAKKVAKTGLRRISGEVLADDTIFDRKRRSGPYLSPLSGLSFNNGYEGGGRYARAPELEAAKELKRLLKKRGVRVTGRVDHASLSKRTLRDRPLASVESPPVGELIEETNVPSNNFFAEMLLKRLGASSGKKGTRKRGANKVEAFAKRAGTDVQAVDGSGLSRKNAASPKQVGKLLLKMDSDRQNGKAFRGSLAIAGREGTLADRMEGTAAAGKCAGKTGTLDGVSALSGYCDAGKHTIVFSVLMNSVNVDAARAAQDRIAAAIARYRP